MRLVNYPGYHGWHGGVRADAAACGDIQQLVGPSPSPPRWRKLHRLVYPAALHYVMLAKDFQVELRVHLLLILGLLALRMPGLAQSVRSRQADST